MDAGIREMDVDPRVLYPYIHQIIDGLNNEINAFEWLIDIDTINTQSENFKDADRNIQLIWIMLVKTQINELHMLLNSGESTHLNKLIRHLPQPERKEIKRLMKPYKPGIEQLKRIRNNYSSHRNPSTLKVFEDFDMVKLDSLVSFLKWVDDRFFKPIFAG